MIYDPVIIALNKIRPGAQWTLVDGANGIKWGEDGATNLIWNDPSTKPGREELEPEIQAAIANHNNTLYQRNRLPEYPSLNDLADAIFWQQQGDNSKMEDYVAKVAAVKEKYPKE